MTPTRLRLNALTFASILILAASSSAFDTPLSDTAVREAYFLGQHNDRSTAEFFPPYLRTLPPPRKGPYVAEGEIYTPYVQIIENSRRRSMRRSRALPLRQRRQGTIRRRPASPRFLP